MAETMVRASGGYSKQNLDDAHDTGYNEGVAEAQRDTTAEVGHVLRGRIFTTYDAIRAEGTMPNNGKTDIVVPSRLGSQGIPAGYHNGNGVITVAAPSGTKILDGSQTGVTDLSPYDFKNVDASAVYTAGAVAGRSDIISNWKSHIGFTFDNTDSDNYYAKHGEYKTILSDLGYGLYHNHIAIIAVAASDKEHGDIPYMDCVATGTGCSPIALKTTGRNHNNVRVEEDIFIYKLQPGAYEIKIGDPDYDVEVSVQVWIINFS